MQAFLKRIIVAILTWEAQVVLKRYNPRVVAVTGNVGKTGTKDAIYTLLAANFYVRKSEKSFNSELGVPLTILGLPNAWNSPIGWLENLIEGLYSVLFKTDYPEWLVLECGADRPGDLKRLAWIKPHVVVYTRFPEVPVHVEYFETPDAMIAEKRELGKALRSSGTLIINADDPQMSHEEVCEGQQVLSYGFGDTAAVRGADPEMLHDNARPIGMACTVRFQDKEARVELRGTLGVHQLYPLLAALAVAVAEGRIFSESAKQLGGHVPSPGRMRLLDGVDGAVLIDDTYNASPAATHAALSTLEVLQTGRKVAVLGDMMELGDFSVKAHEQVGEHVAHVADVFVAVGVRMRTAAQHARVGGGKVARVEMVQDDAEAVRLLKELLLPGDTVLVKGSQSMRMEKVVEALLVEPSAAPTLLVRQDKEWKKR